MLYDNNVLTHKKTVEEAKALPGFGMWTVLLALAGLVVVLHKYRR